MTRQSQRLAETAGEVAAIDEDIDRFRREQGACGGKSSPRRPSIGDAALRSEPVVCRVRGAQDGRVTGDHARDVPTGSRHTRAACPPRYGSSSRRHRSTTRSSTGTSPSSTRSDRAAMAASTSSSATHRGRRSSSRRRSSSPLATPRSPSWPARSGRQRSLVWPTTTRPLFADYQRELRVADGVSHFVRKSGRFPLCGRGKVNTYAVFAEVDARRDVADRPNRA